MFAYQFANEFNCFGPHDASKFLSHILNGVTQETVDANLIKAWASRDESRENFEKTDKFFSTGIINRCFALSTRHNVKCEKGRKTNSYTCSTLLVLNSERKTLKERLEENFGKKQLRTF